MKATPLTVQKWLNAPQGYSLDLADGRIKIIHAFQMLCPGCVYHGIPQTVELFNRFQGLDIDVVGLHTVFEHHQVMNEDALKVFIKEWRLPFPVAIDQPVAGHSMPATMRDYDLQGTPSTILIDQAGEVLVKNFGFLDTEEFVRFVLELSKQTIKKA